MTSSSKFCEEDLWRILWRKNGFQWLQERMQYTDFDLDGCLSKLEEDPTHCEAAFSAFWGTYLANEIPPTISDTQLGKAKKLLESGSVTDNRIDKIKALAYVKLHLAGLLAVCLIRPDWPTAEFPGVVSILKKALECYALVEAPEIDIDDPPSSGQPLLNYAPPAFSIILINGIVRVELSLMLAEQRQYEEALYEICEGAYHICATTIEDESDQLSFIPYLPHSGQKFSIQEAIDIFEEIVNHARDVKNWDEVRNYCEFLRYLGFFTLYDPGALVVGKHFFAESLTSFEYWGRAVTFAEERQRIVDSPFPVVTRDAMERAETRERLKRDFFPETWNELTEEAREILVDAEIQWMHRRVDNVVKEIRPLLEIELKDIFPLLEATIHQTDPQMILTRMKRKLETNPNVQASINGLRIGNNEKAWVLTDLPKFLQEVIHTRTYFEKEQHLSDKTGDKHKGMLKGAISIRKKLLGIGCEGVLPRLLSIKKVSQPKSNASNFSKLRNINSQRHEGA